MNTESASALLVEKLCKDFWGEIIILMDKESPKNLRKWINDQLLKVGESFTLDQILDIISKRYDIHNSYRYNQVSELRKQIPDLDTKVKKAMAHKASEFIYGHMKKKSIINNTEG